jgi:hypothetical protein
MTAGRRRSAFLHEAKDLVEKRRSFIKKEYTKGQEICYG